MIFRIVNCFQKINVKWYLKCLNESTSLTKHFCFISSFGWLYFENTPKVAFLYQRKTWFSLEISSINHHTYIHLCNHSWTFDSLFCYATLFRPTDTEWVMDFNINKKGDANTFSISYLLYIVVIRDKKG